MEKLKKLAIHLGYDVHIINDEVYYYEGEHSGYVKFLPLTRHASLIEEYYKFSTEYLKDTWIVAGKLISYADSTPAKARLAAALSYME